MLRLPAMAKTIFRRAMRVFLIAGLPVGGLYLLLASIGLMPTPYSCLIETRAKIPGLGGYDFEVSETSCDFLAKDDAVSVFVSKVGGKKKDLLFKYDPARPQDAFPVITIPAPQTIQIAVPWVSSIFSRQETWNGVSIIYKIDRIEYPDAAKNKG